MPSNVQSSANPQQSSALYSNINVRNCVSVSAYTMACVTSVAMTIIVGMAAWSTAPGALSMGLIAVASLLGVRTLLEAGNVIYTIYNSCIKK